MLFRSGTVVLADRQTAGRGRSGRTWTSEPGLGLWMTVLHRPVDVSGFDVLSLRIGLLVAPVLDRFADGRVTLKWPNDVLIERRKLAGLLVEARWRESSLEWVAIGIGVNVVAPPGQPMATGLRSGTRRSDLVRELVGPIREACATAGVLTGDEMVAFSARDAARGKRLAEPAQGRAGGITNTGALIVETATGAELFRRGSLVFASEEG